MSIIDCHSHIGIEYYRKDARNLTPESYCRDVAQQMHITDVLLMPHPSPVIEDGMFSDIPSKHACVLRWKCDESLKPTYYSECDAVQRRNLRNPYTEVNEFYFKSIRHFNAMDCWGTRAYFVPLCHPILDSDDYWEKIIREYSPPAIKIHTVGSASLPSDISQNKIDIIKHYDIPIILHTDCRQKCVPKPLGLEKFIRAASPYAWADFLNKQKVKGVLNHGGRLEDDAFTLVSKSDYVYVALGPDYYLSTTPEELTYTTSNDSPVWYLKHLCKSLPSEKILFDMDYDYNLGDDSLDCQTVDRICKVWDPLASQKILFNNANDLFFNGMLKARG